MKKLLFFPLVMFLSACSSSSDRMLTGTVDFDTPEVIQWEWEPKAINFSYSASDNLNLYDEQPHALMVCMYQLSDNSSFNELSTDSGGINSLLSCSKFDSSVVHTQRIFIQPGESASRLFDRYAGTRFVSLVAGYSYHDIEKMVVTSKYPIEHQIKRIFFSKVDRYSPGKLDIVIEFGDQGVSGE